MTGHTNAVRCVLNIVQIIRPGLCLENAQQSQNAWFQLWNMEAYLWWFGQQYLGILLVLLVIVSGQITASDYVNLLGHQVHCMVQVLFPKND